MFPQTNIINSDIMFKGGSKTDLVNFWYNCLRQVMDKTGYQTLGPLRMEYGKDGPQPFLMVLTGNVNKTIEWIRRIRESRIILKGSGLKIISIDNANEFSRYTYLYRNSAGLTQASIVVGDVVKVSKCLQSNSFPFSSVGYMFVDLEEMDSLSELRSCCTDLKFKILNNKAAGYMHITNKIRESVIYDFFGNNIIIYTGLTEFGYDSQERKQKGVFLLAGQLIRQGLAKKIVAFGENENLLKHLANTNKSNKQLFVSETDPDAKQKMKGFFSGGQHILFTHPRLVKYVDFNYNMAVFGLDEKQEEDYLVFKFFNGMTSFKFFPTSKITF